MAITCVWALSWFRVAGLFLIFLLNIFVFRIRWYSDALSHHWYTSFVSEFDTPLLHLFMWLVVAPFACIALHTVSSVVLKTE